MANNKQLKSAYKLQKFKIGVFQIRNTVNNKIYIDSSVNLDAIWNRNRMELKAGNHRNEIMQKEWNEMGEENFRFEILSEVEQKDDTNINYANEAKQLAEMYIDELKPFDEKGYNRRRK